MRILMLGNSFTYYHGMPRLLAALTGAEVVSHTRGGGYLAEHLDAESEMGVLTLPALQEQSWDYVVLQDNSSGPICATEKFQTSAAELCKRIHAIGATPVFYATWSYRDKSEKLANIGLSYDEMADSLFAMYHRAAEENGGIVADVGEAFRKLTHVLSSDSSVSDPHGSVDLLEADNYHPTTAGSTLAAVTLANTILCHAAR